MQRALCHFAVASLAALAGGCTNDLGSQAAGVQSIEVRLKQCKLPDGGAFPDGGGVGGLDCSEDLPAAAYGTPTSTVTLTDLVFDLRALGADGNVIEQDFDIDVYLSFSGNKIGVVDPCGKGDDVTPLAVVHLTNGVATGNHVPVVRAYGDATLWLEEPMSHALGTSPRVYFAQPTIPDVQTPLDLTAPTATYCSPWDGRHAIVDSATVDTRGPMPVKGQMVVTSVFNNSYVICDTGAMWDPMTNTGGFNFLYVFSFGQPPPEIQVTDDGMGHVTGSVIQDVSGNLAKFVGFMELNFPLQDVARDAQGNIVTAPVPPPYLLHTADASNEAKMLRIDGATVTFKGAICHIDTTSPSGKDQWLKYDTFVMDEAADGLGQACANNMMTFSVELPGKTFGNFDPMKLGGLDPVEGANAITVTGMIKNSSGQNEVCKGYGHDAPILCTSLADCQKAAVDPQYPATCQTHLAGASTACVEGSCKRGNYNFWTIVPRTPSDIIYQ
jgi:hypothetical protein